MRTSVGAGPRWMLAFLAGPSGPWSGSGYLTDARSPATTGNSPHVMTIAAERLCYGHLLGAAAAF